MSRPNPQVSTDPAPHGSPIAMLSVDGGPMCGAKVWASFGNICIVGRGGSCDLCIVDPRMSREHFSVSCVEGLWVVCDLNSSNGTFLNDRRIHDEVTVDEGDVLVAGDTRFLVHFLGKSEATGQPSGSGLREPAND